jgi:very-short-patch-repair endonuclease
MAKLVEQRKEINKKISESLKGNVPWNKGFSKKIFVEKECLVCEIIFRTSNIAQECCSISCSNKSESHRKNVGKTIRKLIASGKMSRWSLGRQKLSYPEEYFKRILDFNKINYEIDKAVGRYFIDFALIDYKVALEIDGKQHEWSDRKESDLRKDKLLLENGWRVFRIKWRNPRTIEGKNYLVNRVNDLMEILV